MAILLAQLSCRANSPPAFVQLTEAQRLTSELRINFAKASDVSDRAVMADTDEDSIKFAHEAGAATKAMSTMLPALAQALAGLGDQGNIDLLARFQERFSRYQILDREILGLAVENTNLKAQQLLFGPEARAANEFCGALQAVAAAAPASHRGPIGDAVARAQLAVREIQVLQAPHIAEPRESEMARLEREMASRQAMARDALRSIEQNLRPPARVSLDAAKVSLDQFEALSRKLIELSRKNSNVRSLQMALKQKPALTSACDESLATLQAALAKQGFTGTR